MKKIINSALIVSVITFLPAIPLKAELFVALVINETSEDVTLQCGDYVLAIPAGARRQPLHLALDSSPRFHVASIGSLDKRVYFWCDGADLVCKDMHSCVVALQNMNFTYSQGLLIRVTPEGVIFRLLADFEKTSVGTICA